MDGDQRVPGVQWATSLMRLGSSRSGRDPSSQAKCCSQHMWTHEHTHTWTCVWTHTYTHTEMKLFYLFPCHYPVESLEWKLPQSRARPVEGAFLYLQTNISPHPSIDLASLIWVCYWAATLWEGARLRELCGRVAWGSHWYPPHSDMPTSLCEFVLFTG